MRRGISEYKFPCCFLFLALIALALCTIFSCGGVTPTPEKQFPSKTQRLLEEARDAVVEKYAIPGTIAWINYPDVAEWISVSGLGDQATDTLLSAANRFRIGGLTKTFTATVALQLVDEAKITLDDTLDSFNLEFTVPNERMITVRQLLNHTSGLYDYSDNVDFIKSSAADFSKVWTPAELVQIAIDHGPYFLPGGGYHYSDTNYIILGRIIEKITKRTLSNQIAQRIVSPLELKYTALSSTPITSTSSYSHGYIALEDGTLSDVSALDPSGAWASGGMMSYYYDLEKWAAALGTGQLLSADTFAKQTSFSGQSDFQYGLGIMKIWGFLGHDGQVAGYSTAMFYLPEKKATIIVMMNKSNSTCAALELFQAWQKLSFRNNSRLRIQING
jgi:D-alanyl-D-alanine carboxypeptidase